MSSQPNITNDLEIDSDIENELVVIGLGANLASAIGSPADSLRYACQQLRSFSSGELLTSSLYKTSPVDCPPGSPDFYNAIATFRAAAGLTPGFLLLQLQQLEAKLGRQRGQLANEARCLDLDIIAIGNHRLQAPTLTLPHPRAHQRVFVLAPLSEIAAELVLPGQTVSAQVLLNGLSDNSTAIRLEGSLTS